MSTIAERKPLVNATELEHFHFISDGAKWGINSFAVKRASLMARQPA